jgi:leucyl-tRNA synthetase
MHLIYARFVTKALRDFGFIKADEPFKKLVHQGLITNQGAKMSKSKGNVVSPDEFIDQYGSDVFRMYLMFMGPFTAGGDWNDTGIKGVDRFVQRIFSLFETNIAKNGKGKGKSMNTKLDQDSKEVNTKLHATIKKVSEDIPRMQFNTALSALMELLNIVEKQDSLSFEALKTIALLIAPLAPHLAEELWGQLGGEGFIIDQKWPEYDPKQLVTDTVTVVVQINGKVRAEMVVPTEISEEDVLKMAKDHENVQKYLSGKELKKEIYIKSKLVSLVVAG